MAGVMTRMRSGVGRALGNVKTWAEIIIIAYVFCLSLMSRYESGSFSFVAAETSWQHAKNLTSS
jgi:hypothetical protein